MDYFYDGQVRRYVTQFMRVFIGFKYKTGGDVPEERHVPVMYGDMTRQVAGIIKDNSENKLSTVPRMACYISGLELDTARLADASFISKIQVHERSYESYDVNGDPVYQNTQGSGYTVERLMPTPFKLSMKCDIWTSNTDQKLQLIEQILVLFNPSLEIQTTDNYLDWTSLSVLNLKTINFSSRTIPQGADTEIDICSIEFEMPIYITPPAKVKKLGIVRNIITNVFTEAGDLVGLNDLVFNGENSNQSRVTNDQYSTLLMKSQNGQPYDYDVSILDIRQAMLSLSLEVHSTNITRVTWEAILEQQGGYTGTSLIHFTQPNGFEITGTFVINELDPAYLLVTLDPDTVPTNTIAAITAIIDPYSFNPERTFNGIANIPVNTRYLMLDDVNPNNGNSDGPDAWKNLDGNDPVILANSIIQWNGSAWNTAWDPSADVNVLDSGAFVPTYFQNLKTGMQYRWTGLEWVKSFEGEYAAGYWRFNLDA